MMSRLSERMVVWQAENILRDRVAADYRMNLLNSAHRRQFIAWYALNTVAGMAGAIVAETPETMRPDTPKDDEAL